MQHDDLPLQRTDAPLIPYLPGREFAWTLIVVLVATIICAVVAK